MATTKLFLVHTLLVTICSFALVSGNIKSVKKFKAFIRNKVIGTFRPWAQEHEGEQFAALMLLDTDKNWDKFEFSPAPLKKDAKTTVQPPVDKLENYAAALPEFTMVPKKHLKGGGGNKNKVKKFLHSEQRLFEKYLEPMILSYVTKNQNAPKAMVLYSWIVPCIQQSCPSKGTKGCTSHIVKQLETYAKQIKVIVAYTTLGGGMTGNTKCDADKTEEQLKAVGIDVIKVDYNSKEEAIIEKLIKIGALLETLE